MLQLQTVQLWLVLVQPQLDVQPLAQVLLLLVQRMLLWQQGPEVPQLLAQVVRRRLALVQQEQQGQLQQALAPRLLAWPLVGPA